MTPPTPDNVVVAAAIVDDRNRVLAAQRAYPPELCGRWELPGGKVHPGESDEDALVRECREELDVEITVGERAAADVTTVDGTATLRTYWASIASGRPHPREHLMLRWLGADELDEVNWLDADVPVVAELRSRLASRP